jgi:diguanylate cyclase
MTVRAIAHRATVFPAFARSTMFETLKIRFRDLSVDRKVLLLNAAVGLVSTVLALVTVLLYVGGALGRDREAAIETKLRIVAANSAAALSFSDQAAAMETLSALADSPEVISATLQGRNGESFAEWSREKNRQRGLANLLPTEVAAQSVFFTDVEYRDTKFGRLVVRVDPNSADQVLMTTALMVAGIMAVAFLLSLLVARRLARLVVRPLIALQKAMADVTRHGSYDARLPVPASGARDEVARIAVGFNEMLAEIQRRDDALANELVVRERIQRRLDHLAHHDGLTGLSNRVMFMHQLDDAIASARSHAESLAVLYLDLDNFKIVNDTKGHDAGDRILEVVADVLKLTLRREDCIARLGGDEFAILVRHIDNHGVASRVAEKILGALDQLLHEQVTDTGVRASIGIAMFPEHGDNVSDLLKNADTAMYHAKANGKHCYTIFSANLQERVERRAALEAGLRRALEREEFWIEYQPQLAMADGSISGVEALLRWKNAELGIIGPDEFIPIAEETGLIDSIGEWVLRQACADIATVNRDLGRALMVSVNISGRQLQSENLLPSVIQATHASGLAPALLDVEITESMMVETGARSAEALGMLRMMGVSISLDDFGTGYSSMAYLGKLPLVCLKIDRSFVSQMTESKEDASIIAAILALASGLKLRTVSEGVETQAQLRMLAGMGCTHAQGYCIARPLRRADLVTFIQEHRAEPFVAASAKVVPLHGHLASRQ